MLNRADPLVASWRTLAAGNVQWSWTDGLIPSLAVPGNHNRQNAACAAAAAQAAGVREAIDP